MCAVALKSMTFAVKAKKALNDYYIDADIVKLEPEINQYNKRYMDTKKDKMDHML